MFAEDGHYDPGSQDQVQRLVDSSSELFYEALGSLSDLRFSNINNPTISPLERAGNQVCDLIWRIRDGDMQLVITDDLPEEASYVSFEISPSIAADEKGELIKSLQPPRGAIMINLAKITAAESKGISPDELLEQMKYDLIPEAYIADAFLNGDLAERGLFAIAQEAVIAQERYLTSTIPPLLRKEDYSMPRRSAQARARRYTGERRNLTDMPFAIFRSAAKSTLETLLSEENRDEHAIAALEKIISEDPADHNAALSILLSLIFNPTITAEAEGYLIDQQIQFIVQKQTLENQDEYRRAKRASFEKTKHIEDEAERQIRKMSPGTFNALFAEGLVGVWLENYVKILIKLKR